MNHVTLMGRLGSDLELRYTPKGTAVAEVNLAIDDGRGEHKRTAWIGLTFWGAGAEAAAKYFHKGRGIVVEGRLSQDEWDDKETQKKKRKTYVTVERWHFPLGEKRDQASAPDATRRSAPAPDIESDDDGDDIPF